MRFTRIPLIATLLAGALSLLFLLPAFGQSGEIERTEGRQTSGDLQVSVFNGIADAQTLKLVQGVYPAGASDGDPGSRTFYRSYVAADSGSTGLPGVDFGDLIVTGPTMGAVTNGDPAYQISPYTAPRNTFFRPSLYIGVREVDSTNYNPLPDNHNDLSRGNTYNTALITLLTDDLDTPADACGAGTDDVSTTDVDESMLPDDEEDYPVARVSNPSRGYNIDIPLLPADDPEDGPASGAGKTYVQAFFNVVDDTMDDDDLPRADRRRSGRDCFYYASSGHSEAIPQIAARHGDRLTVRITGEASNISLIVDAENPEINLISPADESVLKSGDLDFRFDVRDSDSGLRHDGEYTISEDGDPTSVNPDRDPYRGSEPLSVMTASLFGAGNGKAADIQAVYWSIGGANSDVGDRLDTDDMTRADDITDQGSWTIIGGRAGLGYSFSASGRNFESAKNALQFTAADRVGNMATSDADLERDGNQPFIFEVDDDKPTIANVGVRTGITYDNGADPDPRERVDRSAIALTFSEPIKSGDVETNRITVAGNTVTGVIQPSGAPITYRAQTGDLNPEDCTDPDEIEDPTDSDSMIQNPNECPGEDIEGAQIIDPRLLVFLELGTPLDADDEPSVTLLSGAVQDLAGNSVDTTDLKAQDWIAPTLTVSVTGTQGDRPVANDDGAFVVEVTSDEDLSGRPRVVFAQIVGTDNGADEDPRYTYAIGANVSTLTDCNLTPQEEDRKWRRSCGVGEQVVDPITGMIGVFVLAKDEDDNFAAVPARWVADGDPNEPNHRERGALPRPATGNAIKAQDLDDAGLLIEVDNIFNAKADGTGTENPVESVTPQSGDDANKTESPNPFIHIDFTREGAEYNQQEFKDSHGTVTITEMMLGDRNLIEENVLSRVAKDEFSVVLRGLAVGKYTLTYKAEDDAGNEYNDGEFKFDVLARKAYKVNIKPGWNLVSVPGSPENTGIADVLSGTEFLTPVLAYQNGDWLTARRTDDGWDGSLTDIEAGYGYWVHAQTFETISTLLTEIDPASVPPTVPVTAGWNLLGVIDVDQRSAGNPPGDSSDDDADEADDYFGSIPWKVAYSFDTQASAWQRYTPETEVGCRTTNEGEENEETTCEDEILNGNGYWVWSERPSTLVP